jgi:hypothetical protein
VCGFVTGTLLTLVYRYVPDLRIQKITGAAAVAIVTFAWITALRVWA